MKKQLKIRKTVKNKKKQLKIRKTVKNKKNS